MNKVTTISTSLEDCAFLTSRMKQGVYAINDAIIQLEKKYCYKFKAKDKDAIREFYDKFCCNRKEKHVKSGNIA
jgi:hypothetical protein